MNPACSASLLMNDTDVRFHLLHTYMIYCIFLGVEILVYVFIQNQIVFSFFFLEQEIRLFIMLHILFITGSEYQGRFVL